jgi:hypothetical protein
MNEHIASTNQFIYNVSIKVTLEISDAWLKWMKEVHIDEVIATNMFDSYSFFELLEPSDDESKTFIVQYNTDSESRYKQYIREFAPQLRQNGYDLFGDNFIAFRSIMRTC